jgi:hypothetical protein
LFLIFVSHEYVCPSAATAAAAHDHTRTPTFGAL